MTGSQSVLEVMYGTVHLDAYNHPVAEYLNKEKRKKETDRIQNEQTKFLNNLTTPVDSRLKRKKIEYPT